MVLYLPRCMFYQPMRAKPVRPGQNQLEQDQSVYHNVESIGTRVDVTWTYTDKKTAFKEKHVYTSLMLVDFFLLG